MEPEEKPTGKRLLRQSLEAIQLIVGTGIIAIVLFCFQAQDIPVGFAIAAFGIALAGAALLGGALVGLLFAIPRKLQGSDRNSSEESSQDTTSGAPPVKQYEANSNLEQISDWLTKIIVGVGLTQIDKLGSSLIRIGEVAAPGLGDFKSSGPTAIAIVLFFTISGFLWGYLWTRLFLGRFLNEAENASFLQKQLSAREKQIADDVRALELVARQLDGRSGTSPTQEQLNTAIRGASRDACRASIRVTTRDNQDDKVLDSRFAAFWGAHLTLQGGDFGLI